MPKTQNDRPNITLDLVNGDLKVTWGPNSGPWGIYNESMVSSPANVAVTEWWLIVGTKRKADQPDEKDEPTWGEIVFQRVGTSNEMTIPRYLLPVKEKVLAQVIGFFDSKNERNEKIREGIYSDVKSQLIPK